MFGVVAVMALLQVFGYANSKGAQYVWPALVFVAGLFLPVYIVLQRGLDQIGVTWAAVIRDSQQREHFLMALLSLAAGLAEILRGATLPRAKRWGLVAPSAFIAIGVVLFVHTEYGTPEAVAESVLKHRYMGVVIALAGMFKAADVLWRKTFRWLAFPWIALLLIAALLLMTYREPAGAYRTSTPMCPNTRYS